MWTKIKDWLRARWKGALVALGALGGLLLFWRVRKPHLPWDDDPTPVDLPPQVLTPAQGQEAVKRILAESEAQRERDAAELAAKKQRALEAANKWDPK
jgi:hypothetical protein